MQVFVDILRQTFRALWANKLRTFLTMFGIAWGVGSLLLLVGLGEGFRSGNERGLKQIGDNVIFIFPGLVPAVEGQHDAGRRYFLTERDARDIANEAPHVMRIAPVLQRSDIRIVSQFQNYSSNTLGASADFDLIRNLPHGEGRWLNQVDLDEKRNVMVIGEEVRKQLFPHQENPIGAYVLANGIRFQVVGTIALIGRDSSNGNNARTYIPFTTMREYFPMKGDNMPDDALSFVNITPIDRASHTAAVEEAHRIIARNHGFDPSKTDAFDGWDTVESSDRVGQIFTAMDMFLGGVGMVTLALGAIGVINIMLVSVSERTREIGLRKALGATSANVLLQFCFEGAFLTIVSGLIGMFIVWGFMLGLQHVITSPQGFDPPTLVPASAALAIGALAVAGIAAGLYPARQAALLAPVEALRRD